METRPGLTGAALGVVVPVLDDAAGLSRLLARLEPRGFEVVVVDAGSRDESVVVARAHGARVLAAEPNRGAQLDAGWRAARAQWIWFLHADSGIDEGVLEAASRLAGRAAPGWGRFDIAIRDDPAEPASAAAWQRVVGAGMNWRSAATGICTGDQGIFCHRCLLALIGGVPRQPLMEDIELSKRLRRLAHPVRIRTCLATDARRWRRDGVSRTVTMMWWLRARYWAGAEPVALARRYYDR